MRAELENENSYKSEVRDGMRIDWDVPIPMEDGIVLRCDVFRPVAQGQYPALLSYGPYGKGLSFQEGYPTAWKLMVEQHPDVSAGSSHYRCRSTCPPRWSVLLQRGSHSP